MDQVARLEIKAVSGDLVTAENRLDRLEKQGKKTEKATDGITASFGKLAIGTGLVTAATALMWSAMDNIRSGQKLNAMLKTATGSAQGASAAMDELAGISGQMPNTLEELTRSFIKLENLGLDSSQEALLAYGETASAMGRDLDQLIEAVADATVGEFERLKEFGIKARSEGDNVSFTFRGVTTTVRKNASQIEDYLIGLGSTQFSGSMAAQMQTIDGQLSNLSDSWFKFTNAFEGVVSSPAVAGLGFIAESFNSVAIGLAAIQAPSLDKTTVEHLGLLKALRDDQDGRWIMFGEDREELEARIKLLEGIKSHYDDEQGLRDQVTFREDGKGALEELRKRNEETLRLKDSAYAIAQINEKIAAEQSAINRGVSDWAARVTEVKRLQEEREKLELEQGKKHVATDNKFESFFDDAKTELQILQDKQASEMAFAIAHNLDLERLEAEHQREMRELQRVGFMGKLGEMQGFFSDLQLIAGGGSEKIFKVQKALALAMAAIDLPSAVSSAFAKGTAIGGPPVGFIYATLATAQQGAQIAAIESQTFAGNYSRGINAGFVPGNSYSGDRMTAGVNSGEAILTPPQQREFINLANGRGSGGGSNSGSGYKKVEIHNYGGSRVEQRERDNGQTLQVIIPAVVNHLSAEAAQGRGKFTKTIEGVYGLRRGAS